MPKTRDQKEQILTNAKEKVLGSKSIVFVGYHGLSVPQIQQLRRDLMEKNIQFQVIKKTIIKRVLDELSIDVDVKNLGDGLAVAYAMDDEVSAAKVLAEFQKGNESLQIYGGVLEKKFMNDKSVIELSKILSRPELHAKLVGSINYPISGFVNTLSGVTRGFIQVLNGIKESKS